MHSLNCKEAVVGTANHLERRAVDKLALQRTSLADKALHQHANFHTQRECVRVNDQIRTAQQVAHLQASHLSSQCIMETRSHASLCMQGHGILQ